MKKLIILMTLILSLSLSSITCFATSNITITGNFSEKFYLDYDNDKFLQISHITPGSIYTSHMYLENFANQDMCVKIDRIITTDVIKNADKSLSDVLQLWIYEVEDDTADALDGTLLYSGKYSDARTNEIVLAPKERKVLSVIIGISPDADNEYQGLSIESQWCLSAVLSDSENPITTIIPIIPTENPTNTIKPTDEPVMSNEPDEPINTKIPTENTPKPTKKPSGKPSGGGGSGGVDPFPYEVHYVDKEGLELAETTYGEGFSGRNYTVYAKVIDGYKPDFYMKVFWMKAPKVTIDFVYTKTSATAEPTKFPIKPTPPESIDPNGDNPSNNDPNGNNPNNNDIPPENSDLNNDNPGDGSMDNGEPNGENDPNGGNPNDNDSDGFFSKIFRHDSPDMPSEGDGGSPSNDNGIISKPVKTGLNWISNSVRPIGGILIGLLAAMICCAVVIVRKLRKKK